MPEKPKNAAIPEPFTVPLWERAPGFKSDIGANPPSLTVYPASLTVLEAGGAYAPDSPPLILVFPGGGYVCKAPHEGEPVARWLNGLGFAAAVVDYRVAPYRHPIPLMDARQAVRLTRSLAENWGADSGRIGALGFSAGGHLVSQLGVNHYDFPEYGNPGRVAVIGENVSPFPDALVLCYPVISLAEYAHEGSAKSLLGDAPALEIRKELSSQYLVDDRTPPTFIWHTADDGVVPVQNTLMFCRALADAAVPFESHIFASGQHGLGLAEDQPAGEWTELCGRWLKNRFSRA